MPVNQTKDVLWPDPKGVVQVSGLSERQGPEFQPAPGTEIKHMVSHSNKLLFVFGDNTIWWLSDDGAGNVTWVRAWPDQQGPVSL